MRSVMVVLVFAIFCCSAFGQDGWAIQQPQVSIPDSVLSGEIFGRKFDLGSAEINEHALTIKSKTKSGVWAESEIIIFVGTKENQKEWTVTPDSEGMLPHVHMKFAKPGKRFPGTLIFMGEYSMRLVFTEITKRTVKGKLHISFPDYKKSYLIGSFVAKIQ